MTVLPFSSFHARLGLLAGLAVLLAGVTLLSLTVGAVPFDAAAWRDILAGDTGSVAWTVCFQIRLPRALLGICVGAGLAVSGAILQGVMRNPLAAPGIIGVSAGGGLAGILAMLAFPALAAWQVPAAFLGALATVLAVYLVAWKRGVTPVRLILSGVAISSMLGAWSGMVLLLHAEKAGGVLEFTVGSLSTRSWHEFYWSAGYFAVGLAAAFGCGGRLNILALGDETAVSLGVRVERLRIALLATAALLAAAAVSVAGLLGFVGLIAPHIVRLAIGADNRWLLPGAALFGGLLVAGCDTLGRVAMAPEELPVGILMSLLGAPFFLWLLRRRGYEA